MSKILTLGDIVRNLRNYNGDAKITFDDCSSPLEILSWRGDYYQLSIQRGWGSVTVEDFRSRLLNYDGTYVTGYKGGEFYVDRDTLVYADDYGSCQGNAVVGFVDDDDVIIIITELHDPFNP